MAEVTPTPNISNPPGDDWPSQAADTIVKVVGTVRDRTTGNAITAARAVVYGLLAGFLGVVALALFTVLLGRVLAIGIDSLLGTFGGDRPGRAMWITDVVLGLLFMFGGLILWKKATASSAS